MRIPEVKIFDAQDRELYYGGEPICRAALISFKYVFSEVKDSGDSVNIKLGFTKLDWDVDAFDRGQVIKLQWGYRNWLSEIYAVAITDVDITYNTNGWIVIIKAVSVAEALSVTASQFPATIQEKIVDQLELGVDIVWEYRDYDGSIYTGKILKDKKIPSEPTGEPFSIISQSIWPKGYIEKIKEAKSTGEEEPLLLGVVEPGVASALRGSQLLLKNRLEKKQEAISNALHTFVAAADKEFTQLMQLVLDMVDPGSRIVKRNDQLIIKNPNLAAKATFIIEFGTTDIIELKISQKRQAKNPSAHSVTLVDAEGKKTVDISSDIRLIEVHARDLYPDTKSEAFFTIEKNKENRWVTKFKNQEYVWPEEEIKRILQQVKRRGRAVQAEEGYSIPVPVSEETANLPFFKVIPKAPPAPINDLELYVDAESYKSPPVPTTYDKTTNEPITAIPEGYLAVLPGLTAEEEVNKARSEALDSLYYSSTFSIKVEGKPPLVSDFNFRLKGFHSKMEGRYYAEEVTHEISRNGYTTTIQGIRVDFDEVFDTEATIQGLKDLQEEKTREMYKYLEVIKEDLGKVLTWDEYWGGLFQAYVEYDNLIRPGYPEDYRIRVASERYAPGESPEGQAREAKIRELKEAELEMFHSGRGITNESDYSK